MAKTDTEATPDLSGLLGIAVTMEDVTTENASQIRSARGRKEGEDVIALRQIVQESLTSGKAKVFTGIQNDKQKDTLTRKVRQAGKGAGPVDPSTGLVTDVEMATSFDKATGKLFWGPKVVIDQLTGKAKVA